MDALDKLALTDDEFKSAAIIDSTKLRTFKSCPRKYLYNYALCWVPDYPNVHLEFGVAWHLAKEFLLLHGTNSNNVEHAYEEFLGHYRQFFDAESDGDRAPKSPGYAIEALLDYVKKFSAVNNTWKVLGTEIALKCVVGDGYVMSMKMDALIEDANGDIWVLDHKTAGRDSGWDDSWNMSFQMSGYVHAAKRHFGERVKGALIDVTLLRKSSCESKRVAIYKSDQEMREWNWTARMDFLTLENEWNNLDVCASSEPLLHCFRKNTESCTQWGRCPYMNLCIACGNPLSNAERVPIGFRKSVWNPHSIEKGWRPRMSLTEDGIVEAEKSELERYCLVQEELQIVRREQASYAELAL